ncbi:MAG: NTP transferase domain-containing protein [Myxococcota bacterium]
MTPRAIILAAGMGERLVKGQRYPKPMEPVLGVPLIVRVIRTLHAAGVQEIGIVIGHLGDVLREGLAREDLPCKLTFFDNDEYRKPNGTSLLKAREFVVGPTILTMSDHLYGPELPRAVGSAPLNTGESALGIDRNIAACFDLPDATKVKLDGERIVRIHKELEDYDALDTGVFLITEALVAALDEAEGPDGCSLSDGVQALARKGRMRAIDVGSVRWIDVDHHAAHAEAERLLTTGTFET